MIPSPSRRAVIAGASALGALATPLAAAAQAQVTPALQAVLDYAQGQNTTGFLIIRDRNILVECNWPAPANAAFKAFTYGTTADGALLEDVA